MPSLDTPWAAVEGNHDQQSTVDRKKMMDMLAALPGSISQPGPARLHGYGNYYIKLQDAHGNDAFTFYMLDSGDNSKYQKISGYDWIWNGQCKCFDRIVFTGVNEN